MNRDWCFVLQHTPSESAFNLATQRMVETFRLRRSGSYSKRSRRITKPVKTAPEEHADQCSQGRVLVSQGLAPFELALTVTMPKVRDHETIQQSAGYLRSSQGFTLMILHGD